MQAVVPVNIIVRQNSFNRAFFYSVQFKFFIWHQDFLVDRKCVFSQGKANSRSGIVFLPLLFTLALPSPFSFLPSPQFPFLSSSFIFLLLLLVEVYSLSFLLEFTFLKGKSYDLLISTWAVTQQVFVKSSITNTELLFGLTSTSQDVPWTAHRLSKYSSDMYSFVPVCGVLVYVTNSANSQHYQGNQTYVISFRNYKISM